MKNCISSLKARQFAPNTTFWLLSLFSALLLVMPTAVQAMTVTVTVNSPTHPVGGEVVVTAVADGTLEWPSLHFAIVDGPNSPFEADVDTFPDKLREIATLTYVSNGEAGVDTIEVYANYRDGTFTDKGSTTVEWIDDSPKSVSVVVGGWDKLKTKKWGGVSIAICGAGCTDSFNVYDIDLDSVQLVGVSPWGARFRDSRLCPDGKDAYVDLVLRFKRREVVEALEHSLGVVLEDGDPVTLEVTGSLKDGTPFKGEWVTVIEKWSRWGRKYWWKER